MDLTFFHTSWHRRRLEKIIKDHAYMVAGKVLDVGSKNRRYDKLFLNAKEITAVDKNPIPNCNVIAADACDMPFSNSLFDTVVSFEVLEYILDTNAVLREISRVSRTGGLFVFSVPFLNPIHLDHDVVRYSLFGWKEILSKNNFEIEKVVEFGGRYSLIWDFYFEKVRNGIRGKVVKVLFFFPLLISRKICECLDKRENNWRFPMGYFLVCRNKKI